jgi:hypothetical protein
MKVLKVLKARARRKKLVDFPDALKVEGKSRTLRLGAFRS